MTEDDKALVEELKSDRPIISQGWKFLGEILPCNLTDRAADRIEALIAENEKLREALGWFLNDSRFVVQVGGNPNVVPQMIEAARAALGETK